ncbi:hypothetical protein AB9E15_05330 [Rhizobium leguminosarum]|uniref:hypothetical protein n=1 Tax=Rhizobium leguminosarum TaxID=384 RepID=UPI003F9E2521
MLPNVSLSQLATYGSISVGAAFVSYVVRTLGYFSIVGPDFFPLFIQSDLIMGAILETRFVAGVLTVVYVLGWYISILERYDHRIRPLMERIPFLQEGNEVNLLNGLAWVIIIFSVISSWFLEGDSYLWITVCSCLLAGFSILFLLISRIEQGRWSIFLGIVMLVTVNAALTNLGKSQAIQEINHPKVRYSVIADDKNYTNVILLRVANSGILLKVGSQVIFYDRAKIKRIDLAADQLRQR